MKGKKRADGGKVTPYDAAESGVEKEAKERKKGGRVKRKDGGRIEGEKEKKRMDRPCRKDGGRVGSDQHPFSSAQKVTSAKGHSTDD